MGAVLERHPRRRCQARLRRAGITFPGQQYALLVSDEVFDHVLARIKADGVPYSAGAGHTPNEINNNHGGRGVYFDDPSGHHFELITQPYGADL